MRIDLKSALSSLPPRQPPPGPRASATNRLLPRHHVRPRLHSPRPRLPDHPHPRQNLAELYIVIEGSGALQIRRQEATPFPFVDADVLFVPAGQHHRFVDFAPDLITWAIFWGPARRRIIRDDLTKPSPKHPSA